MTREKNNIAELLKDCPNGMELDCAMCDNVTFVGILDGNCYPIHIQTPEGNMWLSKYGCMSLSTHAKCIIFPKGKTTWEGFHRPFDDGDIVATEHGLFIGIVRVKNNMQVNAYCSINDSGCFRINSTYGFERIATEEEKQKLFDAIKANGYKWNPETKTLEKLTEQKFDITTLKPFDKVLVRDGAKYEWRIEFFSHTQNEVYMFACLVDSWIQCVPYEGNEHLLGTINDCDEFYKTWK